MRESQGEDKITINWSMVLSQAVISLLVFCVFLLVMFLSQRLWLGSVAHMVLKQPELQEKLVAIEKLEAEVKHYHEATEGLDKMLQGVVDLRDKLKTEVESGKIKDLREDFFNFIENLKGEFKKLGKNLEKTLDETPEKADEPSEEKMEHEHSHDAEDEEEPAFPKTTANLDTLEEAVEKGGPFLVQLEEALEGLGEGAALAKLRPYAAKGVPSLADLQTKLSTYLQGEIPPEKKGLMGFINSFIRVESRERVKRIECLEEACEDLNQGDLATAISKIEGLEDEKYQRWLKKAQARLEVDKIIKSYKDGNVTETI